MAALEIACPNCGRLLKLPDRRLIGRMGRCVTCNHKFRLHEPEEATARVAEQPRSKHNPPIEFSSLDEDRGASGHEASGNEFENLQLAVAEFEMPASARLRARSQRRKSSGWIAAVFVGFLLIAATGWLLWPRPATTRKDTAGGLRAAATDSSKMSSAAGSIAQSSRQFGEKLGPISLRFVPMGARIVVHLRPADLWSPDSAEFRACLGPLADWIETQIRSTCLFAPEAIDEALFALIPVSREQFAAAVVVRTRESFRPAQIAERFGGASVSEPAQHYINANRACVIDDERTFAIVPEEMAAELFEAIEAPTLASDGIQALLNETDRSRHFTLAGEITDMRLGRQTLVPSDAQSLLLSVLDHFGEQAETVCWSFHLRDAGRASAFTSELLIRYATATNATRFTEHLQERTSKWPRAMLDLVYRTHPRTVGERKIVGRFPIMTKVVQQSLAFATRPRAVALAVELPEKAAPNLALAARLTWQQTLAPDFDGASSPVLASSSSSHSSPTLPASIAERLKKKIDVDFRDDFLHVAIAFVGEETGVAFQLDGNGMKLAGVTQNERQKFALSAAPATAVLHRLLNPRGLVLVVDEQKQSALVTSIQTAQTLKLTPFPLTDSTDQ